VHNNLTNGLHTTFFSPFVLLIYSWVARKEGFKIRRDIHACMRRSCSLYIQSLSFYVVESRGEKEVKVKVKMESGQARGNLYEIDDVSERERLINK